MSDELDAVLRSRGLRATPQRRFVLDALERLGHATPASGPSPSTAPGASSNGERAGAAVAGASAVGSMTLMATSASQDAGLVPAASAPAAHAAHIPSRDR